MRYLQSSKKAVYAQLHAGLMICDGEDNWKPAITLVGGDLAYGLSHLEVSLWQAS